MAAAIQIAFSEHQDEAREVLGLDDSLMNAVETSLRASQQVEIDRSMVTSVLNSRKGAETTSNQASTMYM